MHLYLDLEFKKQAPGPPPADEGGTAGTTAPSSSAIPINTTIDGDALVDGVVSAVAARLAADHGVAITSNDVLGEREGGVCVCACAPAHTRAK